MRRLVFDVSDGQPPPRAGDVLRPAWPRGRAWYRVTRLEPVDSRVHPNRWRLWVERVAAGTRARRPPLGYVPSGYDGPEVEP